MSAEFGPPNCPKCGYAHQPTLNCQAESSLSPAHGSVTPDALIVAFVQGAQWWEYHKTGATMWASDRDQAEGEAETRASSGTLGKSPNDQAQRRPNET